MDDEGKAVLEKVYLTEEFFRNVHNRGPCGFLFARSGRSCGERSGWKRKPRRGGGAIGKISIAETGQSKGRTHRASLWCGT